MATFSRTKWMSISICLVRLWWTGFRAIYTLEMLSQYVMVALLVSQCSSCGRCRNQVHSETALATPWYSASVVDHGTCW
jgi:hypothetical protein